MSRFIDESLTLAQRLAQNGDKIHMREQELRTKLRRQQLFNFEVPEEFMDVALVIEAGRKKYPNEADGIPNWLHDDGKTMAIKTNADHMFHHLADFREGHTADRDSGLHPTLHLACRALMAYTRYKRGLRNELD